MGEPFTFAEFNFDVQSMVYPVNVYLATREKSLACHPFCEFTLKILAASIDDILGG